MNAARAAKRPSLRDVLPDETRPALHLKGRDRARMMGWYVALNVVIFGGLLFTLSWSPLLLLASLVVCYFLENLLFVLGHIGLHVSFIETPESKMTTVTHSGFVHHYRDIRLFHNRWLSTRLALFVCSRVGFGTLTSYAYVFSPLATTAIIALIDWRVALCFLSCAWATHLLQAITHEWYHNDQRETFYWAPTRWLMTALEWSGLISTQAHRKHHRHHLHNLETAHHWLDQYIPGGERLGDAVWTWLIRRHEPGKLNMISAIRVVLAVVYPLYFVVVTGMFAGVAWLIG